MRLSTLVVVLMLGGALSAVGAEVESRVWTHYLPQDVLETAVRTEGWTEVPLEVKGGVRKGDTVRLWIGGSIDRGNGDRPGDNVNGAAGPAGAVPGVEPKQLALSPEPGHAFALLVKTETSGIRKAPAAGKALEIVLTKDRERLWLGFNDEKGRFADNHLGRGRRHELDPLWVRVEVVRTVVD